MRRFILLVLLAAGFAPVLVASAQGAADLITLNDANPSLDIVVALPPDTTGAVALDFNAAVVTLVDAAGATVFQAGDPRLHGLEMNIAPNSGAHTLSVARLPGQAEAHVRIRALPELTQRGGTELVSGSSLSLNQEIALPSAAGASAEMVSVNIPPEMMGVLTATFPGADVATRVTDARGVTVAQSTGSHVDGLNLVLEPGDYQLALQSADAATPVRAAVRAVAAMNGGPVSASAAASVVVASEPGTNACTALVATGSVNLRSGPGTGYTVLGYGYRDDLFPVGGHNPEDNWVLVGTATGSGWIARESVRLRGDCAGLTTFEIPMQDALPASLLVAAGSSYGDDDDDHEEHDDDDEHEDHDDDDD